MFQINAFLLNFSIHQRILEKKKISESPQKSDEKFSFAITGINYIVKYIKIEHILL